MIGKTMDQWSWYVTGCFMVSPASMCDYPFFCTAKKLEFTRYSNYKVLDLQYTQLMVLDVQVHQKWSWEEETRPSTW